MKKLPKISVIIPSYNKVKYIETTIKSVLDQKYPNLELIIQDGGSTDGSLKIIKKYSRLYKDVVIFESKEDNGQTDAINIGLNKATGDLLAFINADDIYTNSAFEKVAKAFTENPNAMWFAGGGSVINDSGDEVASLVTKYKNFLLNLNSYTMLLIVNYIMQPSVFLNKKTFKKYGGFTGVGKIVLEYSYWLNLGRKEMPFVIKSNISKFRLYDQQFSSNSTQVILKEDIKIIKKFTKNPFIYILHTLHNWGRLVISSF